MLIKLIQILLIAILFSLQVAAFSPVTAWNLELVLAGLIAVALTGDITDTVWWVIVGGLLLDLLPGSIVGFHLLIFALIGLAINLIVRHFLQKPALPIAALIALISSTIFELLLNLISHQISWYIIASAVITSILAVLFYASLVFLGRKREVIRFG